MLILLLLLFHSKKLSESRIHEVEKLSKAVLVRKCALLGVGYICISGKILLQPQAICGVARPTGFW